MLCRFSRQWTQSLSADEAWNVDSICSRPTHILDNLLSYSTTVAFIPWCEDMNSLLPQMAQREYQPIHNLSAAPCHDFAFLRQSVSIQYWVFHSTAECPLLTVCPAKLNLPGICNSAIELYSNPKDNSMVLYIWVILCGFALLKWSQILEILHHLS